jgi:SAM-dependent methyltransferase
MNQYDAVEAWVRATAEVGAVVLDVGAGDGDHPYPARLEGIASSITGVDPDAGVLGNTLVDERVQATLEAFAPDHEETYDLALVLYVVEHIAAPRPFMTALRRCLRPGGAAFVLTPNRNHYFGFAALAAQRLHVDEWLLRRLRDEDVLHDHHYPIQYRMNSRRTLSRQAAEAGFTKIEFRMIDEPGIYEPYFPQALRWVPSMWSRAVHSTGAAPAAGTILAKLTR